MGDVKGKLYRCSCGCIADEFLHNCESRKRPCGECGVLHDGFGSRTTGYQPCLRALSFLIEEMREMACQECGQKPLCP